MIRAEGAGYIFDSERGPKLWVLCTIRAYDSNANINVRREFIHGEVIPSYDLWVLLRTRFAILEVTREYR